MDSWPMNIGIEPYYEDKYRVIFYGDCREVLPKIHGVTSVVTDPPYELGFMGKSWDSKGVSFDPATWWAVRQSCKLGAMMLSFGGTRTYHRIVVAIEDAGWEIRDCIMWLYGTGFPKSMDVSKAIDKSLGAVRSVIGTKVGQPGYCDKPSLNNGGSVLGGREDGSLNKAAQECQVTAPATAASVLWNGYGTALKPAYEPIALCMNPVEGTFANNALVHGAAGINIDGCRVQFPEGDDALSKGLSRAASPRADIRGGGFHTGTDWSAKRIVAQSSMTALGRFPANIIHDGSDEVVSLFPQSKGQQGDVRGTEASHPGDDNAVCFGKYGRVPFAKRSDGNGSAARFFYTAKASGSERHAGLSGGDKNSHVTVKPLALVKYLCKLVSYPENNLILDPFVGSGTTLLACAALGIRSIGIDNDEKSCEIAANRCAADAAERLSRGEY